MAEKEILEEDHLISIGTAGAKKVIRRYDHKKAISEYIWNGFDAGATIVRVSLKLNDIGILKEVTVEDNGTGIDHSELNDKFKPFYESIKEDEEYESHSSKCHGRNGLGRLTFFTFANFAEWSTVYQNRSKKHQYSITIKANELKKFEDSSPKETTRKSTGTIVKFTEVLQFMNDKEVIDEVINYLKEEFCWYLELNSNKNYKIILNDQELSYQSNIKEKEEKEFKIQDVNFKLQYVGWQKLHKSELSKIYYLKESKSEVYKEFTQLNRKSDGFFHSVFISSVYFENFKFESSGDQSTLGIKGKSDKTFRLLLEQIREFLLKKRKPILKENSKEFFKTNYENEGIVTSKGKAGLEKYKAQKVKTAIEELWIIEPRIFTGLNYEQKKVMANFIELCLDTGERDRLIEIIDKIVKLEPADREQLHKILKDAELSYVIRMLNMITTRFKNVEWLKQIIFRQELNAKEVVHVQSMVEKMTWFFGEQYATLGSQEDNFEKLLRQYRIAQGDFSEITSIEDQNKKKEVDLFLCRKMINSLSVDNLIVELKRPSVRIGKKQIEQIETYMLTILKEPQFNNVSNATWTFLLIGKEFDTDGYTESRIASSQNQGIMGLVLQNKNYKIIVKKWSELLTDFEIQHNFIQQELKLSRDKLVTMENSADDIIKKATFEKYEEKKN